MQRKETFKNKSIIIIVIALSVFGLAVDKGKINAQTENNTQANQQQYNAVVQQTEILYFYGRGCPFCKDVEKFMEENNIADKINVIKKEIWYDQKNANEMQQKVAECNIAKEGVGVPFVFVKKINNETSKNSFLSVYSIKKGNNLWNIIKEEIKAHGPNKRQEQIIMVDNIKDKFKDLSPDKLKEIGFSSGNIGVLRIGDELDLRNFGEDLNLVKCYIGKPDIEAFFKQAAGIQ